MPCSYLLTRVLAEHSCRTPADTNHAENLTLAAVMPLQPHGSDASAKPRNISHPNDPYLHANHKQPHHNPFALFSSMTFEIFFTFSIVFTFGTLNPSLDRVFISLSLTL